MHFFPKKALVFTGVSCILLGMVCFAQGEGAKKEILQEQIGETQEQLKNLDVKHRRVLSDLEKAQMAMAEAQLRANVLKKDLQKAGEEIALAKSDLEQVTQRVKQTEAYASRRLAEYYKLTQTGMAPVILGSDSVFEASVRQNALRRIINLDNQVWENLTKDKARLGALTTTLEKGRDEQIALERELKTELAQLNGQKAEKKKLLAQVDREKGLAKAALESLEQAAKELSKAITRIAPAPKKPLKPSQVPAKSFVSLKGHMELPIPGGKILAPFGAHKDPRFKATRFRSGVDIAAETGEPFHAVHEGRVVYSGWFKGYGNMIIIDHGDAYFSVCAHAEDIFKEKGQPVEAGEVIGTVGDSGSFSGPGLYFEIRHHSTPLDPAVWLRKDN
ncbi:MAG: peptidoglycan DD-metalloendopeptidase family protein [Desulfatibacillum sp.]|nr:peptidoglycan DD-metalloendopeptidase family protein [Desulfatibacillum sp.]